MKNKIKYITKIVLGWFLVVGTFMNVLNYMFITIGAFLSYVSDYDKGVAVGKFFGSLSIWLVGLWFLISGYKQKKKSKSIIEQGIKAGEVEN